MYHSRGSSNSFWIHKQLENRILKSIAALPEEDLESLEKGVGVLNQVLEQADWRLPVDECLDDRASIDRMDADRALHEL